MGCKRVPEQMRVYPALQSGALTQAADNTLNGTRLERLVWRFVGHKQAVAAFALHDVLLHHQPRTNREVHHTVLVTLAGDLHRPVCEIEICRTQLRDFTKTAAGRHKELDQRFLPVRLAGIAQTFQFLNREGLTSTLLVQLERLDLAHRVLLNAFLGVKPSKERTQCGDVRLQRRVFQMARFIEVRNVAANVVGRYLGSALVHPGGKHFEVAAVVPQGLVGQAVNALCTEIILDSAVQIAARFVRFFRDRIIL